MMLNPIAAGIMASFRSAEVEPVDTYAAAVLLDSPVAYWRLGEDSTEEPMVDETGNHTGSYNGGTLGDAGAMSGNTNTAYTPGASGYGSIPHAAGIALSFPFSIEFWFKHTGTTNVILIEKNNNVGISIQRSTSNVLIMNMGGTGSSARISTTGSFNDGSWHHCVFVADPSGGGSKVYIDAVDDTDSADNETIVLSTVPWYIGSRAGSNAYDGTIDEVAFYDYALSEEQVLDHYLKAAKLWTPADLDGPLGPWLNDDSDVTNAGSGACSQWSDVSGNDFHFSMATGSRQPLIIPDGLNGRRVIRGDGLNDALACDLEAARDVFRNQPNAAVLAVYRCLTTGGLNAEFVFNASVGTGSGARLSLVSTITGAQNRPRLGARRLDADSFSSVAATSNFGTDWVIALVTQDWATGLGSVYVNGEFDNSSSLTSSGNTSDTRSNDPLVIFGNSDLSQLANSADIDLAELLVFAGVLPNSAEIDKLFGYAAHRWGLTAALPVGHPYKYSPPTTVTDPNFSSVVSLLQMQGADGSTSFPDVKGKVWTPHGNAQIDRTDPDFPDGALLLDGDGDYLSTTIGEDWNWGDTDWTVEGSFKLDAVNTSSNLQVLFTTRNAVGGTSSGVMIDVSSDLGLRIVCWDGVVGTIAAIGSGASTISAGVRYDYSFSFIAGTIYLAIDGEIAASGAVAGTIGDAVGSNINIARDPSAGGPRHPAGLLGPQRITKGVGRYSENYTPPDHFPNSGP